MGDGWQSVGRACEQRRRLLCAGGFFLTLLGIYLLTTPGRIDIVDGQWRYEVARNWLGTGEPSAAHPYALPTYGRLVNPATGKIYSVYNAAPSITPMPFMFLSRLLPGHTVERDQFAFTLAGPCFGALLGILLLLAYGWLRVGLRPALGCASLFCLATLWWPASLTTFDQNQHAVLLLAAVLLAWQSGCRQNPRWAAVSGLLGGLLLNYQEMYALLLPIVGLAVLASRQEGSSEGGATLRQLPDRAAARRYLAYTLGCCGGMGLFCAFNLLRFGTPLALSRYGSQPAANLPPTWGDPLVGLLSLAISPGKGIFWFSPPLLLVCFGARRLWARAPALALTVAGVSLLHLLVISHLTFFGGDWCWGPRYAIPVMPLWALAFPFATSRLRRPRRLLVPLVAIGLSVQILGISLDSQRFFYERNLPGFFWVTRPWFYFHDSQLIARPFEISDSIRTGLPAEAGQFSSAPMPVTRCLFSPYAARYSRLWVRHFQMFYLPRPWWGWMGRVPPAERPVDPSGLMAWCAVSLVLGSVLLAKSLWASPLDFARDDRLFTQQAEERSAFTAPQLVSVDD